MGGLISNQRFYLKLQICKYPKSIPHSDILEWGNFLEIFRIFLSLILISYLNLGFGDKICLISARVGLYFGKTTAYHQL